MSSAAPIKFRCSQCNKLLGVSRSKVGAIVACPQCRTELIVPEPLDSPPEPRPPAPPQPPPRVSPSSSRIEPGVVPWDASPEQVPTTEFAATTEPAFPAIQIEPISLRPEPVRYHGSARPRSDPAPPSPPAPPPLPPEEPARLEPILPSPTVPRDEPQPLVLPGLDLETDTIRDESAPRFSPASVSARDLPARRNDVVLPRTAVVLWSFLVLLALVFAFAAGLLAGRFLWAPGVKIAMPTARASTSESIPRR